MHPSGQQNTSQPKAFKRCLSFFKKKLNYLLLRIIPRISFLLVFPLNRQFSSSPLLQEGISFLSDVECSFIAALKLHPVTEPASLHFFPKGFFGADKCQAAVMHQGCALSYAMVSAAALGPCQRPIHFCMVPKHSFNAQS